MSATSKATRRQLAIRGMRKAVQVWSELLPPGRTKKRRADGVRTARERTFIERELG